MELYQKLGDQKQELSGKHIVGIDPAKAKHQAMVLNPQGMPLGNSFHFPVSYEGYHEVLWQKLTKRFPDHNKENTVFAIECSCNLWQTLAHHLHSQGFTVVMVSAFKVSRTRAALDNDFSKTDPKDAYTVAYLAAQGFFHTYKTYSSESQALHRLSITYDKLRKDYVRYLNRLISALGLIFPEFSTFIKIETKTALYLLKNYQFPVDFIQMDMETEGENVRKISHHNYDEKLLIKLKLAAEKSIGIPQKAYEMAVSRQEICLWIAQTEAIKNQMENIMGQMIEFVKDTKDFEILTDIKGISHTLAALFMAETRTHENRTNYKQIEKYAGFKLIFWDSGKSKGLRIINPIGNKRLRWILYKMIEETVKFVPEVRSKFIRRQLRQKKYRKNIIACSSIMLKLISALIRDNRKYKADENVVEALEKLEIQYDKIKKKQKKSRIKQPIMTQKALASSN